MSISIQSLGALSALTMLLTATVAAQDNKPASTNLLKFEEGVVETAACASRCMVQLREGRLALDRILFSDRFDETDEPDEALIKNANESYCSAYQDNARVGYECYVGCASIAVTYDLIETLRETLLRPMLHFYTVSVHAGGEVGLVDSASTVHATGEEFSRTCAALFATDDEPAPTPATIDYIERQISNRLDFD